MEKRIIVIAGPTCSGKTELSILLAEKLNTEIISADSRQIYKHLDIGTAKATVEERERAKHHLVDCFEPDYNYSASKFENDALAIIDSLHKQNKVPIVVGGSGLYIQAVVDGIFEGVDTDEKYREHILSLREQHGNEFIYNMLKDIDPVSAEKMLPQNWKRVLRALEVFNAGGKTIWELQSEYKRDRDFDIFFYGLNVAREILYPNIESRVDLMMEEGLLQETKKVLEMGYSSELNSLNTVGYKEIVSYLNNEISLERAIELIKRNTRRFAKRQYTWFRRYDNLVWKDVAMRVDLKKVVNEIYGEVNGQ